MPSREPLNDYTRRKLRAAVGFVLVAGLVLEAAVRVICRHDADGNRWFGAVRLKPYRLPAQRAAKLVREYETATNRKLKYDPDIGWLPQPSANGNNAQSFYCTATNVSLAPATNKLRIAIFGASYAAGSYDHGWWRALEKSLNNAGVPTEVLNFGCGGYAMDQAFLRWRKDGATYQPHVVLFGFTRQNGENNLNLLRLVADPESGIPFMKPRFLLAHDQLVLTNAPTPAPAALPEIVAHFRNWPLAAHEEHFAPADFATPLWRRSALGALFEARANAAREREADHLTYQVNGEAAQLALKIIAQFKTETESSGSRFYVVHLPTEGDLRTFQAAGNYPFADLLAAIQHTAPVIQPEAALLAAAHDRSLARFFWDGHYINEFNPAIGQAVADALLARPEVARFRAAP
jgi:hypothetical protein